MSPEPTCFPSLVSTSIPEKSTGGVSKDRRTAASPVDTCWAHWLRGSQRFRVTSQTYPRDTGIAVGAHAEPKDSPGTTKLKMIYCPLLWRSVPTDPNAGAHAAA